MRRFLGAAFAVSSLVTIEHAAAGRATLVAMLVALVVGSALLVPALVYLYRLLQRAGTHPPAAPRGSG